MFLELSFMFNALASLAFYLAPWSIAWFAADTTKGETSLRFFSIETNLTLLNVWFASIDWFLRTLNGGDCYIS